VGFESRLARSLKHLISLDIWLWLVRCFTALRASGGKEG